MLNLRNIKEKIIQLCRNIKNRILPLALGGLIITTTIIALTNIFVEKGIKAISDPFKNIEIEDCIIKPISYEDSRSISETLQENRNSSEEYGGDILHEGITTNIYLRNNNSKSISISESSIVIDDIKEVKTPQIYLIAIYDDVSNLLSLYLVNNNLGELNEGLVEITVGYVNSSSGYMNNEMVSQMLNQEINNQILITFKNLRGGEIRKIASYELNLDCIEDLSCIGFNYKISNNNEIIQDGKIGISYIQKNIIIDEEVPLGPGSSGSIAIVKSAIVNVREDKGKKVNIPTNFSIDGENIQSILYTLYPTSSCVLKFHIDLKDTHNNHIKSNVFEQEVYVPLYEDEDLSWNKLIDFIKKYKIETYYYHSNPIIQKEIDYSPPNKDTDYLSPNSDTETYDSENY